MSSEASITFENTGEVTIARVHLSELTSQLADAMLAQFAQMVQAGQPARLVVDLSSVKFIDSIALGTLVVLLRRVKQDEGRLVLAGLGGHALRVLQVTGLEKIFDLRRDVPSAVDSATSSS
jgi:anti-sigma B factor antagonist